MLRPPPFASSAEAPAPWVLCAFLPVGLALSILLNSSVAPAQFIDGSRPDVNPATFSRVSRGIASESLSVAIGLRYLVSIFRWMRELKKNRRRR